MCTGVVRRSGKETKGSGQSSGQSWIDQEIGAGQFTDVRLDRRLRNLVEQLSTGVGESIPLVCQDWANTKAAYRFLSNERVSEAAILAGHFQSTRDRFLAEPEPILILHDTTAFSFQRQDVRPIGILKRGMAAKGRQGRLRPYTTCGLFMHSSLAVTTEGLPLGLA